MPTESEWEYACRAGSGTAFCYGDDPAGLEDYGWYYDNSGLQAHPVGLNRSNAWGLYDMHGNVWEWCQDWYGAYPDSPVTDPSGPKNGISRVARGGGWYFHAPSCRSGSRNHYPPARKEFFIGFRLVMEP